MLEHDVKVTSPCQRDGKTLINKTEAENGTQNVEQQCDLRNGVVALLDQYDLSSQATEECIQQIVSMLGKGILPTFDELTGLLGVTLSSSSSSPICDVSAKTSKQEDDNDRNVPEDSKSTIFIRSEPDVARLTNFSSPVSLQNLKSETDAIPEECKPSDFFQPSTIQNSVAETSKYQEVINPSLMQSIVNETPKFSEINHLSLNQSGEIETLKLTEIINHPSDTNCLAETKFSESIHFSPIQNNVPENPQIPYSLQKTMPESSTLTDFVNPPLPSFGPILHSSAGPPEPATNIVDIKKEHLSSSVSIVDAERSSSPSSEMTQSSDNGSGECIEFKCLPETNKNELCLESESTAPVHSDSHSKHLECNEDIKSLFPIISETTNKEEVECSSLSVENEFKMGMMGMNHPIIMTGNGDVNGSCSQNTTNKDSEKGDCERLKTQNKDSEDGDKEVVSAILNHFKPENIENEVKYSIDADGDEELEKQWQLKYTTIDNSKQTNLMDDDSCHDASLDIPMDIQAENDCITITQTSTTSSQSDEDQKDIQESTDINDKEMQFHNTRGTETITSTSLDNDDDDCLMKDVSFPPVTFKFNEQQANRSSNPAAINENHLKGKFNFIEATTRVPIEGNSGSNKDLLEKTSVVDEKDIDMIVKAILKHHSQDVYLPFSNQKYDPKYPPNFCRLCDKAFSTSSNFHRHNKSFHGNGQIGQKCDICHKILLRSSSLKEHKVRFHNIGQFSAKELVIDCIVCQEKFARHGDFAEHFGIFHSEFLTFKCNLCDVSCKTIDDIESHMNVHKVSTSLGIDPVIADTESHMNVHKVPTSLGIDPVIADIESHMNVHKVPTSLGIDPVIADTESHMNVHKEPTSLGIDPVIADTESHMNVHKEPTSLGIDPVISDWEMLIDDKIKGKAKSIRTYKCIFCLKQFLSPFRRRNHEKTHASEDRSFKNECPVCFRKFGHRRQLEDHLNTHTHKGIKVYRCSICDVDFNSEYLYMMHYKKVHSNGCKFICTICNKEFSCPAHLNKHNKSAHLKESLSLCSYCGKECNDPKKLLIHIRQHHTGERPFKCTLCDKAYASYGMRFSHMKTHTGKREFVCQTCGKLFKGYSVLYTHLRIHTGEKPYKCKICGFECNQRCSLKRHMKTKHIM